MSNTRGCYFRSSLLSRLGHRKPLNPSEFKPFVFRNRAKLEEAHANASCVYCGYRGTAITFKAPNGEQGPGQLVYSSERAFTKALARSTPVCANCYQERSDHFKVKRKAPLVTRPIRTLSLLQAEVAKPVVAEPLRVVEERIREDQVLFSEVHGAVSNIASATSPLPDREPKCPDAQ